MKKITKIAMFILVGLFFSCQKDNIEVIKNLDTSWQVDPKFTEADVRTRLGYDPRFNYALAEQTELDFPMLSLGNLPISGQNTQEIVVKILEPLNKDVVVTLQYDTELYNAIKKDFAGFSLGDENLIQISEKQKTIVAGQTSVSFTIVVNNNSNFKDKVVLPFSFKTDDPNIKLLENKDKVVVKVFNREVTYTYPTRIIRNIILGENTSMYSTSFSFAVQSSQQISDDIQISVRRANITIPNIAPEGIEGDLPEAKSFRNQEFGVYNFTLNTETLNDAEGEQFQLPLELVATIGGQSFTLPDVVSVIIGKVEDGDNVVLANKAEGNFVSNKRGIQIPEGRWGNRTNIWVDGSNTFFVYLREQGFSMTLPETKTITAVKINVQEWGSPIDGGEFYAVNEQGEEILLGRVFGNKNKAMIVNFKVPVRAKIFKFKNVIMTGGAHPVSEVDIYQE